MTAIYMWVAVVIAALSAIAFFMLPHSVAAPLVLGMTVGAGTRMLYSAFFDTRG